MPLQFLFGDITKLHTDAIVNAANSSLLGGGGVDGCIHRAAGPELLEECRTLGGCETGSAKLTRGYRLPAKYVIHTVGPRWQGGSHGEQEKLESCYRVSLQLAAEKGCETIAFPLISSGIFGYPKEQALDVAVRTIREFLEEHDEMTVILTAFDRQSVLRRTERFPELERLISAEERDLVREELTQFACAPAADIPAALGEELASPEERFSEALLRLIDEHRLSDAQCYKKANIDRRLFSKIRSNPDYHPSKATAAAFAVALELSPEETDALLKTAGYVLTRSSPFDIIVGFYIRRREFDVDRINEALFAFGQTLLGA